MTTTPIPEPVPKDIQAEYVQAEQNLMWLAEHGMLHIVALLLASLRRETEYQESHQTKTEWIKCPACGGSGYELDGKTLCRVCDGRKVVPK